MKKTDDLHKAYEMMVKHAEEMQVGFFAAARMLVQQRPNMGPEERRLLDIFLMSGK